jgi:N-acetylmuramoyl-L-alanine amidase
MPQNHTVKQGECILSIAAKNGLFWESVWNHPDNSGLKNQRKNPNELQPGDVVVIPDKEKKEESAAADQRQRFLKKGVPAKLRLKITRNDEPRANEPFTINIDGKYTDGQTDGDGMIDISIPPDAKKGELKVGEGNNEEFFRFMLGTVDPIDTENGARGRLRSLGYDDSLDFADLLKEFQQKEQIDASGSLDDATKAKLEERFGQ